MLAHGQIVPPPDANNIRYCRTGCDSDLASLTLGHQGHLGDVVAGYGTQVELDVIRGWWSLRSLRGVRWLVEHGFDPWPEVAVLRSRL